MPSGVVGVDVMEISRPDGAGNIAVFRLTLSEVKQPRLPWQAKRWTQRGDAAPLLRPHFGPLMHLSFVAVALWLTARRKHARICDRAVSTKGFVRHSLR
jgi:hypothetical protein